MHESVEKKNSALVSAQRFGSKIHESAVGISVLRKDSAWKVVG